MIKIYSCVLRFGRVHLQFAVFLCVFWMIPAVAEQLQNRVKNSPSPYLAIHGDDPVAWQEWSPATIEMARRQNKLLFVSIGYFSCHWCHVMQAESYRNAEIAALINQHFIPVKVDRELEVALDAEMIAYAQASIGSSGWPLNVFITPEGYPLYALLYEKPERLLGIADALGKEWQRDSAGLKAIAKNALSKVQARIPIKPGAELAEKYRKQLVRETLEQADLLAGGINTPRKFPLSPQLAALLEIVEMQPDAGLAEWLKLTLDQMARGGLRDHVGGGFFRYTVDPSWHTPHFEKMLYDNAQLAMIYLRAARIFNNPVYRDVAIETLDFMLEEMRADSAFVTSTSALDGQGREGGAYLWSEAQLKAMLEPDEYALLARLWGMDSPAEFELGYLPMRQKEPESGEQKRVQAIYARLKQARKERVIPRDIKLLAGLNGLALSAFSEAAEIVPRYRQAADQLHDFMRHSLWQKGILHKGMSNGQLLGQGDLESYAYTVAGLMRYAQLSGKKEDAQLARQIAKQAWGKFHSEKGFVLQQRSELARPYYQGVVEDSPLPSPSSILIQASLRSGDEELRKKAGNALADGEALQKQGLFWFASQVIALNELYPAKKNPRAGKNP